MAELEQDTRIRFPSVTVVRASAGSGKTHALVTRCVQLLLSAVIPRNGLRNILAITFSNNAAREMRERVLQTLKRIALGERQSVQEICQVVSGGEERAVHRAAELVDEILLRYSDFQVRTIDSFMATVLRASAIDFGFSPEFEILLETGDLFDYAFNLFLRGARRGSSRARLLDETVGTVISLRGAEESYPWDPAPLLLTQLKGIEAELASLEEPPCCTDGVERMQEAERGVRAIFEEVEGRVRASGLEPNGNSTFPDLLAAVRAGRTATLIGRGTRTPPVRKPPARDLAGLERYQRIVETWGLARTRVAQYVSAWARAFYQPYLHLHEEMAPTLAQAKRFNGVVFISDITRSLSAYLADDTVPDVYFRIGERVFHHLIDEFQDTSPTQWRSLFPLVENSLAGGGSLFAVGDTKQAIYGFRRADYTIMRRLETENPFPSAEHGVQTLGHNYRSRPRLIELASRVFTTNAAREYPEAASRSGLADWRQVAADTREPGHAEVSILTRDDDQPPERERLRGILADLRDRGYRWEDIAVLAARNQDIIRAASWLSELGVPFVSFSSLDVRGRRISSEMLALLSFLDSPPDDLAFATFLLGRIFDRAVRRYGGASGDSLRGFLFRSRSERPLYKAFQEAFPDLWRSCFAGLFRSAGYLPLYDLVCEAYTAFDVFRAAGDEEATLAKLLEVVKDFEGSGTNSLREFLEASHSDSADWAITEPMSLPSVQLMTIHKAKGLGFPVVIALLYGESRRGSRYAILREPEGVDMVRLTRETAEADPDMEALYEEEVIRDRVERLNGLYVALTRARHELYVVGVKAERDTYPFDVLPEDGYATPGPKPRAHPPAAAGVEAERPTGAPLAFTVRPTGETAGRARSSLSREERLRGELIHRMLALVPFAEGDVAAALETAARRAATETRQPPELSSARAAARLIETTELGALFARAPGREVLTEQEFCDATGRLYRMDRVVVDPERVTVVDYKTGTVVHPEHLEETRGYAGILAGIYPGRRVEAILAYLDAGRLRRVV
ncbi:MAG TPA: UvrD-helicase domain-containing protein [Spirochaetia bacterium]|nr:UvrD-helicase domain-containing protein [Spirochaetia bacterium]